MEEKKVIKLRLYSAVVLGLIVIMLIAYIIMFSINKYNSKNKEKQNLVYINIPSSEQKIYYTLLQFSIINHSLEI